MPVSSEKQKTFEEPKIKKSVEQLMAENNSSAKKTAEWNESFFDDSQTVQSKNISEAQNKSSVKSSVVLQKVRLKKLLEFHLLPNRLEVEMQMFQKRQKVLWLILKILFLHLFLEI